MTHEWLLNKQAIVEGNEFDDALARSRNQTESSFSEAQDSDRESAAEAKSATQSESSSPRLEMRLVFVDEHATMAILSRLLATESRVKLLDNKSMSDIKEDIQGIRIRADLNTDLIAARLLDVSTHMFPTIGEQEAPFLNQPVRVEGVIKAVESGPERTSRADQGSVGVPSFDLWLRVATDEGSNPLLRLAGAASFHWTTSDLRGHRILAIGLLQRPLYKHVLVAAVMQFEKVRNAV